MSNLFTINNGAITDSDVFGKDLAQSTTTTSKKGVKLKKTSTLTPYFSATPTSLYGIALNLSSRNVNPIGTLTIEISSKNNGLISTSTYPVSCFTKYLATNNYISIHPQNWQLLELPSSTTLPYYDLYNVSLFTSEEDQLSFVGDSSCLNVVNGDRITTVGEIRDNFSPVADKSIPSVDLTTSTKDCLISPPNTSYGLDAGYFTIEGFFYFNTFRQQWNPIINLGNGWGSTITGAWGITYNSYEQKLYLWRNTAVKEVVYSGNCSINLKEWVHLAIARHDQDVTVWINGVCVGVMQNVSTNFANIQNIRLFINNLIKDRTQIYSDMFVSNIRITKGSALYNSSFQRPQQNLSIRADTLMFYSYPYGEQYLACDSSLNVSTKYFLQFIDVYNKITFDRFTSIGATSTVLVLDSPFNITGDRTIRFNGSNLFIAREGYGTFGSSDFTVELWMKMADTVGTQTVYDYTGYLIPNPELPWIYINYPIFSLSVINGFLRPFFSSTTTVRAFTNGATDIAISSNQWYHIAIVRIQNTVSIYVNGIKQPNTITLTDRLFSADNAKLYIGSTPPGRTDKVDGLDKMRGWVTNLRIIQGSGLYKEDFNVSSPLAGANIANPEPLDPYYEENITGERDITLGFSPVDIATISSTYSLVNGARGVLNTILNTPTYAVSFTKAQKQYLKTFYTLDSVYRVGSGDFTIEAWVYLRSWPGGNEKLNGYCICSGHNDTFSYYIGSSQIYGYIDNSRRVGDINHNIQLNTWTHIAIMRSNNTLIYYQNGVLKGKSYGEIYMTPSIPSLNNYNVYIGSGSSGVAGYFDGNILDFRLTRGRAIYIEDPILQGVNFSLPAPLTVIENIPIAKGSLYLEYVPHYSSESPYTNAPANSENSIKIYNELSPQGDIGHSFKYKFTPYQGDFTIELWHKPAKWVPLGTTSRSVLIDIANGDSTSHIKLFTMPSGKVRADIRPLNISSSWVIESNALVLNEWYHIALTRKNGVFNLYINGTVYSNVYKDFSTIPAEIIPSVTQLGATISTGNTTLYIGYSQNSGYTQSYGFITDVRITPNQCLYPTNPIPVSSLKDSTDLSIQEGTSNLEIIDSASVFESSDHPYDPSIVYGSLFTNNRSIPKSPIVLDNAFTIEAWLKPTTDDTSFYIVSCRIVGRAGSWVFGYSSAAGLYFAYTDINSTQDPSAHRDYQKLIACASILTKNVWSHVAVSRNTNNEWRFYINGESLPFIDPNSFDRGRIFNNTFSTSIAGEFIGYLADIRVYSACLYDVAPSVFLPFAFEPTTVTSDTVFLIKSDSSQDNEFKILDDDFIDISNNLTTDKFVKVYNNNDNQTSSRETPSIITRLPSYTNSSGYYYNGAGSLRRTAILDDLFPVGSSSDWTFECFFKGTTNLPSTSHAADIEYQSYIPPYTNGNVAAGASYWYAGKWTVARADSNTSQPILSTPYFGIGLGKQYIALIYNNKPDSTVRSTAALPIYILDVWNNYPLVDYIPSTPPVETVSVPSVLVDKQRNVLFKHNLTDSNYQDQWHHLVVQRRGEDFICILDGRKLVDDRPLCAGNIYLAGSTSSLGTSRIFSEHSVNSLPVTLYDKAGTSFGVGGYMVFNILPLTKITHIRINVDVNVQQGFTARARNMNLGRVWGEVGGSYNNRFVGPFVGNNIDLDFRYATRSTFSGDTDLRHIRPDNVDNTEAYDECIPGRSIAISWKFWKTASVSGVTNNSSITLNNIMYSSDNGATYHQVPSSWFCDTFKANYSGTIICNTDSDVIGLSDDILTIQHYFYSSSRVENYTPYRIEGGSWGKFLRESYTCNSLPPIPEKYCQYRNRVSFLAANYNSSTGINITNIRVNHEAIYNELSPPSLASVLAAGPLPVLPSTTLLLAFPRKTAQNNIEGIKNVVGNHEVKYLQYGDRDPVTRNLRPEIFIETGTGLVSKSRDNLDPYGIMHPLNLSAPIQYPSATTSTSFKNFYNSSIHVGVDYTRITNDVERPIGSGIGVISDLNEAGTPVIEPITFNGDFEISCWVYFPNHFQRKDTGIFSTPDSGFGISIAGDVEFAVNTGSLFLSPSQPSSSGITKYIWDEQSIPLNTWVHIALIRINSKIYLTIDGIPVTLGRINAYGYLAGYTNSINYTDPFTISSLHVGPVSRKVLDGVHPSVMVPVSQVFKDVDFYVEEIVAIKNANRFKFANNSSDISVPDTPLLEDSNTQLLVNFPYTFNTLFEPRDSYYFFGQLDGSVRFPYKTISTLTTATFEFWIWPESTNRHEVWFTIDSDTSYASWVSVGAHGTTSDKYNKVWLKFYNGGPYYSIDDCIAVEQWMHVALVKTSTRWVLYIDGIERVQVARGDNLICNYISIGNQHRTASYDGLGFTGAISYFQISDHAKYTSDFSLPSAPPIIDANTIVLFKPAYTKKFVFPVQTFLYGPKYASETDPITVDRSPWGPGVDGSYRCFNFSSSGDPRLSLKANTTDLNFNTSFTIEGWYHVNKPAPLYGYHFFYTDAIRVYINYETRTDINGVRSTMHVFNFYSPTFGIFGSTTPSISVEINRWYFVQAIYDRDTYTLSLYVDSVLYSSINIPPRLIGGTRCLNSNIYVSYDRFDGYVSNFRISKSIKSTDIPGGPFAVEEDTLVLVKAPYNGGYEYYESKPTVLIQADVEMTSTEEPFAEGGSLDNKSYVVVPSNFNPDVNLGTKNFTIEWFQKVLDYDSGYFPIINLGGSTDLDTAFGVRFQSSGTQVRVTTGPSRGFIIATSVPTLSVWQHCALVRSSNVWSMYIDKVLAGSAVINTDDIPPFVSDGFLGCFFSATTQYVRPGYISNIRIVQEALYVGADISESLNAPFTNVPGTLFLYQHPYSDLKYKYNAIASTVLLLRSESFPDFIPTPAGNSRDDCMFFDGVRDLRIFDPNLPAYDLGFNNNPYTLELWVYILDSADRVIISRGGGSDVWGKYGNAYTLYIRSGALCWTVAAKGAGTTSLTLKFTDLPEILNKWAHVAVTYDQNATRLYVNGFLSQEIAHDSLPTYVGGNGVFQIATCDTDFIPYFYEDVVGNYPVELRVGNSKSDLLAPCTKSALLLFVKPGRLVNAPVGWVFSSFQLRFTFEERVLTSPADVYVNTYINGVYHSTRGRIVDGRVGVNSNRYIYVNLNTTDLTKVVLAVMGNSNLAKVNTTAEVYVTDIHFRYNNTGTWQELTGDLIQSSSIVASVAQVRSSIESRPVTYSYEYNSGLFFLGHNQALPRTTTQTNFLGYISNLRISYGACLYSNSTYTIPTIPLQITADTALLLTSPYSEHEFTRTVTAPFSDPVIVDSISFLDYRKYLQTADALPYMDGDFCIETWIYCIRDNSLPEYIFDGRGSSATTPFLIGVNEIPGKVRVYEGASEYFDAGDILPRTWHHIAVIRREKTLMIYIDGRLCNTKVSTAVWGGSSLMIGKRYPGGANTRFAGSDNFMGFLSNIRIVNKDTVYIDSCKTPPEDKLTLEPGTVFLLDTGADINKSLITNSTASITSLAAPIRIEDSITFNPLTQKCPWGGDYLDFIQFDTNTCISYAANSSLDLYQTPYLLEAWVYPTTKSGNRTILYTPDLHIYIKDPNNSIAIDGVNVYTTASRLEPFKWYHIVVANNITSTVVFIDGEVALRQSILSDQSSSSSVLYIGSTQPKGGGLSQFCGYMSNVRFTSYPSNNIWLDRANKIKFTPSRISVTELSPYSGYTGSIYLEHSNQQLITENSTHLFAGRYNDFTVETWLYVDFAELTKQKSIWTDRYGVWSFVWGPTGQNYIGYGGSIFWSKFELFVDKSGCVGIGSFSMNGFNLDKSSASTIQNKKWHFVVAQKQGDKIYILVDNIVRFVATYPTYTSSTAGLLIDPLTSPTSYYHFEIGSKKYRTSFESYPFKGWIGDIRILNYAHYPLSPGLTYPPAEPLTNIPGTVLLLTPHELIQTDNYLKSFFNTDTIQVPTGPYDIYPTDPASDVLPTKILLKTPYNTYENDVYLTYLSRVSSAANTMLGTDALVLNLSSTVTTEYILLEHNDKYDLSDTSFNLSLWIYPVLLPVGGSKILLQCQDAYSFYINSENRVCFSTTNSGITTQYIGSSAIQTTALKKWCNIVFNYNRDLNQFAVYINQQVDSMHYNVIAPALTKNHPIYIGNNSNYTAPFQGALSDIHLTRENIVYNPNFTTPSRDAGQDSTIMLVYAFPNAYPVRKYQGSTGLRTLAIDTTTTPINYRDDGVYLNGGTYLLTETTTFYMPDTFTYEAFFQPFTSNVNGSIFSNSRMNLYIRDNIVYFNVTNDSGITVSLNSISDIINPNSWNHIAVVRTTYKYIYLYINGKMYDVAYLAGNITNNQTQIGAGLNGLLSHARISKTNYYYFIELNFLTSKPTSTFYTSLMLTAPYYDSIRYDSFNAVPISTLPSTDPHNSNNDILAFTYEQSITLPDNERFDLNACMWSYEVWVMPVKSVARDMCLFDKRSTSGVIDLGAKIDTLNRLVFYTNSHTGIVTDNYIPYKKWTHIAITCDGAQTMIHINGVFKGSFDFIPLNNGDGSFNIGTVQGGSSSYCGYMANLRVIRGYAAYTTNSFIPPGAPPPFKPNTSLMLVSPYISPYYYVSYIQNIHISSTILPDTFIDPIIVRDITLPHSATVNNLFIHKDGQLRIDKNANVDLKIIGVLGLQITSDGVLNIN